MTTSRHYTKDRQRRDNTIKEIGEGTVIYKTRVFDEKRKKWYRYEITDNAILIVKADDCDLIITKIIARPSRLKQYWKNAPKDIMNKAIAHSKAKMWY